MQASGRFCAVEPDSRQDGVTMEIKPEILERATMLRHALQYWNLGWSVMPLHGKKPAHSVLEASAAGTPDDRASAPLVRHRQPDGLQPRRDHRQRSAISSSWMRTRARSPAGGKARFPATPLRCRTSKGVHFYFRHPGTEVRNGRHLLGRPDRRSRRRRLRRGAAVDPPGDSDAVRVDIPRGTPLGSAAWTTCPSSIRTGLKRSRRRFFRLHALRTPTLSGHAGTSGKSSRFPAKADTTRRSAPRASLPTVGSRSSRCCSSCWSGTKRMRSRSGPRPRSGTRSAMP